MSIVGSLINSDLSIFTPVYWANALPTTVPTKLNLDGAEYGRAHGINNSGQIVGRIRYGLDKPVYWANALATTVPTKLKLPEGQDGNARGINNSGQIVGNIDFKPVYWANLTSEPSYLNFTGDQGYAQGINSLGQIVGNVRDTNLNLKTPVYWANDSVTTVPTSLKFGGGGSYGSAFGINTLGQIVGSIKYAEVATPVIWNNYLAEPLKLSFSGGGGGGGYAKGINSLGQIVGNIEYAGVATPVYWENYLAEPIKLNFTGGAFGDADGINDPPVPISNICFPKGTPIKTDQGIVNIELLDKRTHTIAQKSILHITKTTTIDKYLIRFAQSALGRNVPDKKTIMTKDHQIMFEGRLVPAYRFLDYTDQVKKVKYSGETLYNVLLKEHGLMNVNNLLCETLHPDNIIAKLYLTNYSDEERSSIVYQMNTALLNNDVLTYKAVVDRLTLML